MDKFDLLCLIEAISNFAYDIHYTANGRNFYSDHLFSERLADIDVKDDFIETFYLGESEDAPDSAKISAKVAEITPKPSQDTQADFKKLRKMIVKALMAIENYHGTKGEEDLLGSLAHILQRHNGLLYRELSYTPEEIKNDNDEWERLITGDDVLGGELNGNRKENGFITIDAGTENERVIWVPYEIMNKKAQKRIVEILDNYNGETKFDFEHTKANINESQINEIKDTVNKIVSDYDFKPVAQVEISSDVNTGSLGVCCSGKKASVVSLSPRMYNGKIDQEKWDDSVKEGFHPKGTGDIIKSVLTHEMGHAITVNSQNNEFWGEIEKIRKDYLKNIKKSDIENIDFISNYARVNKEEFVAEAFCQGTLSETFGKYTRQVMEQINKHFKKGNKKEMSNEKEINHDSEDLWVEGLGMGYPLDEKSYEEMKDKMDKSDDNDD